MMRIVRLSTLIFIFWASFSYSFIPEQGDIIFQTSKSSQSLAIQKATNSPYSHMGIILFKNNKPYVYEASNIVKFTPLQTWIEQGISNKYVIKRTEKPLNNEQKNKLYQQAMRYKAKPYDLAFSWSDDKIYCSELVWKIYYHGIDLKVGKLQKLKEFELNSKEVKLKMIERYGRNIPFNETVISPKAIFDSSLLITVDQN